MIHGFLYGIQFAITFAIGTLVLVGLFRGVWETASQSKGLFWAIGWSSYLVSYSSFVKAIDGPPSPVFEVFATVSQLVFYAFVLTYILVYLITKWSDHEDFTAGH